MNVRKESTRVDKVSPFYVMDLMSKARALESKGRNIVHMEVGEPDFSTPQPIVDAGVDFLKKGDVHYTEAQGLLALREKVAEFYTQQYNVKVSPERIFITPGASGALTVALATLIGTGDDVLMAAPGYPCNSNLVGLLGGISSFIEASPEDSFQLSAASIASFWGDATRGVMLASPSNPTGLMVDGKALKEIIKTIDEKNGFLISDEIYHGLVYGERAVSALEFSDDVFVINSFSKFFGMTGWRLGWVIVPEHAMDAANRLMQNLFIAAPTHSQFAALAAFSDETKEILLQRCDEFKQRRDILYDGLLALGFKVPVKPEGAFYIYADCSDFTNDSYAFALDLLEKAGVAVTPGLDFGMSKAERYLRFAYTTSIEEIKKGLERLALYINNREK
jgi:aspartate/methionine/tyrosine aminotransferase